MLSSMANTNSFWDDLLGRSLVNWGQPLQFQRRGGFFNDSLFNDTRSHFDSAVKDIVRSFDFSRRDNDLASYRHFRDRQLTGTDRASSLSEEQDKFKIVMDVHGFIDNDLKVTFLNDNELIVEGQIEKKDEVSLSRQSFKRRFVLPGKILVNEATSALSSDNILTITVPKQLQAISNTEANKTSSTTSQSETFTNLQSQAESLSLNNQQSLSQQLQSQKKTESTFESALQNFPELPITQKKDFFGDSFFENVRSQFQNRVKEIMDRKFEKTDIGELNIYKKIREKDDNQSNVAVTVSGDTKEHKIVLDVHGFSEGDLKVKAVSSNQLVVEGKVEKKSDNSYCNNSFRRSFYLPDVTNIKETTSALSSDGVLTIIVPKLEKPLPIEYSIPITREEQVQKTSNVQKVSASKTTTAESSQPREHIVPIALGFKDNYMSSIQEEKKESTQFQSASVPSTAAPSPQIGLPKPRVNGNARMVPISLAGSFFQDSVFDTAKRKVETAVRDAMSRSSSVTSQTQEESKQSQHFSSQKESLNQQHVAATQPLAQQPLNTTSNLIPQDQSAFPKSVVSTTIEDEAHFYKINLDVFGYGENELKIKTFSHNEICIEGNSEIRKEGSISKQSFQKRFQLPDCVLLDQATSALSSEGMLTITMPKKRVQPTLPPSEHVIPVTLGNAQAPLFKDIVPQSDIESCSASTISDISSVTTGQENQSTQREFVVPLTLEQEKISQQQQQQSKSTSSTTESNLQSQMLQKREESFNKNSSLFDNDFFKGMDSPKINFDLPIARRGDFYQDSFFNDSRDMFESALRGSMSRFRNFSSFEDDMNFYKSLRDHRIAAETTKEASAEDQQFHKILLDVQGYKESDMRIQVLEGNGICVEGKVEEKDLGSLSTRSFKKCFFLPVGFNVNEATTGLSSDGVLTIKVPRTNKEAIAF